MVSGSYLKVTEVDLGLYLKGGELGGLSPSLENGSSGLGRFGNSGSPDSSRKGISSDSSRRLGDPCSTVEAMDNWLSLRVLRVVGGKAGSSSSSSGPSSTDSSIEEGSVSG